MTEKNIYQNEPRALMALVWGFVIAVDVIAVLYFVAGQSNMERYVTNDFNAGIVREFQSAQQNADISAVFLGNSRLRHALPFGFEPDKIVPLPDGRSLAAVQFAPNAGRFDLFGDVSYRLLNSRPDFIFIQDSVITNARNSIPNFVAWSKTVLGYLQRKFTKTDDYALWLADRMYVTPETKCMTEFTQWGLDKQLDFNAGRDRHELTESNPGYRMARDFIAQAAAKDIKIVIFTLPSNEQTLSGFGVMPHETDFYGLGHAPQPEELLPELHDRVLWLEPPPSLEPAYYCDFVHYNAKGRARYTEWLKAQIADLK